jgi:hypothetical protein
MLFIPYLRVLYINPYKFSKHENVFEKGGKRWCGGAASFDLCGSDYKYKYRYHIPVGGTKPIFLKQIKVKTLVEAITGTCTDFFLKI